MEVGLGDSGVGVSVCPVTWACPSRPVLLEAPSDPQVRLESGAAGLCPGGRRGLAPVTPMLPAPGVPGDPPPPWSLHVSDAALHPLESASDVTTVFPACPPTTGAREGLLCVPRPGGPCASFPLSWVEAAASTGLFI